MDITQVDIPDFDEHGNLPPGVHDADIESVVRRFGGSKSLRRSQLSKSLKDFHNFAQHYAIEIYVDGSYSTAKLSPSDVDVLVILPSEFYKNLPAFFRFNEFKSNMKINRLHIFSYEQGREDDKIANLLHWFCLDRDHNRKGIIRLEINK